MKIAITGTSSGFGKYLINNWEGSYGVSMRKSVKEILPLIIPADIFINHAYSQDTKQSELFYAVYSAWENQPKTIINFGSSAILENPTFDPIYVSNKKHLNSVAQSVTLSGKFKKVRVVNFNPSTLENNKLFNSEVNKLKFEHLENILNFIINLPQEVEISDIVIRSTQRLNQTLL